MFARKPGICIEIDGNARVDNKGSAALEIADDEGISNRARDRPKPTCRCNNAMICVGDVLMRSGPGSGLLVLAKSVIWS